MAPPGIAYAPSLAGLRLGLNKAPVARGYRVSTGANVTIPREPASDTESQAETEPEVEAEVEDEDEWPYEEEPWEGTVGPEGEGEEDAPERAARKAMEVLMIKREELEEEVKDERAKVQDEQAALDEAVEAKEKADQELAERNADLNQAQNLSEAAKEAIEAAEQYRVASNLVTTAKLRKKTGQDMYGINLPEYIAAAKEALDKKKSTKTKVDDAVVVLKEGLATLQNNAKKAKERHTAAAALFKAQSSGLAAASLKLKKTIEALEKAAERRAARVEKKEVANEAKAEKATEKADEKKRKADEAIANQQQLRLTKQKLDEDAKAAEEAAKVAAVRAIECESVICQIHWLRQKMSSMGSEAAEIMMVLKGEPLDPDNPDNLEANKPKIPCEIEDGELAWMEKLAKFAMKMQKELEALIAQGEDAMAEPPVDEWNRDNHYDALAGCTNMEDGRPVGGEDTDDEDDGEEDDDGRFDKEMKGYADEGNEEEEDPDAVPSAKLSKEKRQQFTTAKRRGDVAAMPDVSDDEEPELTPESKAALERALAENRERDLEAKHAQFAKDTQERMAVLDAAEEARKKRQKEKAPRIKPTPNPKPGPNPSPPGPSDA